MASSEHAVKADVEREGARTREQVAASDKPPLLVGSVVVQSSEDPLQRPADPQTIISTFRERHAKKLAELEAARKEADEIDKSVETRLEEIAEILRRLEENKQKMVAIITKYTAERKLAPQTVRLNDLNSHLGHANYAVQGVVGWLSRATLGWLGGEEAATGSAGSDRRSNGSDVSIDSVHELATESLAAGAAAEMSLAVAVELKRIDEACAKELEACAEEAKLISAEEKKCRKQPELMLNIARQKKLFIELVEIIYEFLEENLNREKSKDQDVHTLTEYIQGLKKAVCAESEAGEMVALGSLTQEREALRADKQELLEHLMSFVVEHSKGDASVNVFEAVGQIAGAIVEYKEKEVFSSPIKRIQDNSARKPEGDAAELPPTLRDVEVVGRAYKQVLASKPETPRLQVQDSGGVVNSKTEEQLRAVSLELDETRKRLAESEALAKKNAELADRWKANSTSAIAKLKEVDGQRKEILGALEIKSKEVIALRTALNSRMPSAMPSVLPTPQRSRRNSFSMNPTRNECDD